MVNLTNPIPHSTLLNTLDDVRRPEQKIKYLTKKGQLTPIMKGWYLQNVGDLTYSRFHIANVLYGPSYVTSITALSYLGWIADRAVTVDSVVFKRSKELKTSLGLFRYHHLPKDIFHLGITSLQESDKINCLMASPTKALYDYILLTPHLTFTGKSDLLTFLEEDLRFDLERMHDLDLVLLGKLVDLGHKERQVRILINLIKSMS
jgi:predicted transcriptional regulator of viral defense system